MDEELELDNLSLPSTDADLQKFADAALVNRDYGVTISSRDVGRLLLRIKLAESKHPPIDTTLLNWPDWLKAEGTSTHTLVQSLLNSLNSHEAGVFRLQQERDKFLEHIASLHQRNVLLQAKLDSVVNENAKLQLRKVS